MDRDKEIGTVLRDEWKNEKIRRRRSVTWAKLTEFPSTTGLHGLRYITERDLHPVEKIFWIITFTMSLLYCFCLVQRVWTKWQTSPVMVTLSERLVPVNDIAFPAITICHERKNSQFDYDHFKTQNDILKLKYNNDTKDEFDRFRDMALVCNIDPDTYPEENIELDRFYSDASAVQTILKYAPTIDKFFHLCKWHGNKVDCSSLFKRVLTSQGVCYTMNTLASDEIFRAENLHKYFNYLEATNTTRNWIKDVGYMDKNDLDVYPRRGRKNGAGPDLDIVLKENQTEKDSLCNNLAEGFKVYISHPADLPQGYLHYYSIPPDRKTSLALKFEIVNTAKTLSDRIEVKQRLCFFSHERQLRYFRSYSPANCQLECLTNYTFRKCKCVGFYMPHHNGTRICTIESVPCMEKAKDEVATKRINYDVKALQQCSCLPSCNMVTYDAETMLSRFKVEDYIKYRSRFNPRKVEIKKHLIKNMTFSALSVYYKSPRFMSFKRSEVFGTTDFLANCGGLLGLFLGFSVLSLIEIVYFITLRLWCALARSTRDQNLKN